MLLVEEMIFWRRADFSSVIWLVEVELPMPRVVLLLQGSLAIVSGVRYLQKFGVASSSLPKG